MEWSSTLRNVLMGAALLGAFGGAVGCFTLLRRQSLLGDALAHAALPGVCIAFLLFGSKTLPVLFGGALFAGVLGSLLILLIIRGSRVKEDSAIGIVLSVFFGFGVVLLTWIQRRDDGNQSGLDTYLFGQAATLLESDVWVIGAAGSLVMLLVSLFFKEFKILTFDRDFAASMGFPVRFLEILLTCVLVVVVVIGMQTVGVVLMVATLITPAAAARQWTHRLGMMVVVAALIGSSSGAAGAVLSARFGSLPTGPTIVVISSAILVASLFIAPRRGIIWEFWRSHGLRRIIRRENLLKDLYHVGERYANWRRSLSRDEIGSIREGRRRAMPILRSLVADGLVEADGAGWCLSESGLLAAERVVRKHRIWEVYLSRRLDLPSDHLHRDAEAMEHALSDAALLDLEETLGFPTQDPHGQPIPPRREAES